MEPAQLSVVRAAASTITISLGPWPMMIAHLLLAVAERDGESRLYDDLVIARRLATLLGEDSSAKAALSRLLLEPAVGDRARPYVEVELSQWERMRASMLIRAVEVAGSIAKASFVIDIPTSQLRRQLRCAHRHVRRSHRRHWWSAAS